MTKVNPVQAQMYLSGMDYPASRDDILRHASSKGADDNVLSALREIHDKNYETPADVSKAIGNRE